MKFIPSSPSNVLNGHIADLLVFIKGGIIV